MASSSSPMKYHVFLSFRGEDTRLNFTAHLLKALEATGIFVFFDEETLEKGELLSPALSQGIADSRLSIIVLSVDYASSKSCLAELSHIMDRRSSHGLIVLPIFYHVHPSHVRHLGGSFKNSFEDHESERLYQVQRWKAAFAELGKLKGYHIGGGKFDRPDTEYIEDVVGDVIKKLKRDSSSVSEDLVGIDDKKRVILGLIELEKSRVIGLWGMRGIGKTTLAEAVYKEIYLKFQSHCFLYNVRKEIKKKGIKSVRNELLSKLLNSKIEVDTPTVAYSFIQERLNSKRVIVVLDDVDDSDQIDCMGVKNFGDGSKIIVTSTDRQVLKNGRVDQIHEVKKLNMNDSLQLFSTFAFKQLHPAAEFLDLSYKFVHYADGSPLALKNWGRKLYEKHRAVWESKVHKLKRYAEPKNSETLMSTFDGLDELGVINQESIDFSGCTSLAELTRLNDLASLKSLQLNGFKNLRKIPDLSGAINLKRIDLSGCTSLAEFPCLGDLASLETLLLNGCKELTKIPDLSGAINLQMIDFCGCTSLAELACLNDLPSLESLLLNGCKDLRKIPDLSRAINLKRIDFCGCTSLAQLPCLNDLPSLESFLLNGCKDLRKIPCLSGAIRLKMIDFCGCKSLVELPCLNDLPSLESFLLNGCKDLRKIPDLSGAINLKRIEFCGCTSLAQLHCLNDLASLESLLLNGCKDLRKIPSLSGAINLKMIDFCGCTSLVELPCLSDLPSLESLLLNGCKDLRKIPCLSGAINLKMIYFCGCTSLVELPCLNDLPSLESLLFNGCKDLRKIPCLSGAINLKMIDFCGCISLVELPCLNDLPSLESLLLNGCKKLRKIPDLSGAINLKMINFCGCTSLVELPCLSDLPSFETLQIYC